MTPDEYAYQSTDPEPLPHSDDGGDNEYTYKTVRLLTVGCLVFFAICMAAFVISLVVLSSTAHAAALVSGAQGPDDTSGPAGAVCPPGNVKFEADGGYEYTDNSATVELGDANLIATWSPAPGRTVVDVCIKFGGPGGGELIHPDPAAGAWTSEQYAISHVVLTTGSPNSVEITDITAERTVAGITAGPPADYRALVILLVVLAAIVIGIETLGALRRRRWGK